MHLFLSTCFKGLLFANLNPILNVMVRNLLRVTSPDLPTHISFCISTQPFSFGQPRVGYMLESIILYPMNFNILF